MPSAVCLLPPALAALLLVAVPSTQAQRLQAVVVAPRTAAVGQPVSITVTSDISEGLNCNVRVHFGDGRTQDFAVNQTKDARYVLQHVYDRPGEFQVQVEGKTALPLLRCLGQTQRAALSITPAR